MENLFTEVKKQYSTEYDQWRKWHQKHDSKHSLEEESYEFCMCFLYEFFEEQDIIINVSSDKVKYKSYKYEIVVLFPDTIDRIRGGILFDTKRDCEKVAAKDAFNQLHLKNKNI